MRIFLVRHGLSKANVDPRVHEYTPDHAIGLAPEGIEQAHRAKEELEKYFVKNLWGWPGVHYSSKVSLWQSPYKRTRETAAVIATAKVKGWTYNVFHEKIDHITDLVGSVKENICLSEQKFGLFDGLSDEELQIKYPQEHQHYKLAEDFGGRFWAQMPMGESRFDVALRVHQIFGTWRRDYEKHGIDTVIVVSHGVTLRAITMRWLDLPYEWFEQEPNPGNCSIRLIEDDKDCGYIFQGFGKDGKLL